MRLTPLHQEVHRHSRVPHDRARRTDPGRWVVLAVIYCVVLLLTSPFYVYKPPVPTDGAPLDPSEPLKAWTPFRFTTEKAREEFLAQREREHKRIFVYDADVQRQVTDVIERLFARADALDPDRDTAAATLDSLRRLDQRLGYLTEEEVPAFLSIARDPRFRSALRAVVGDAFENHVLVGSEQVAKFRGATENRVVEIVDEKNGLANRREILSRPMALPPDWHEWRPLLLRFSETYGNDPEVEEARRTAEVLLTAFLQPNLRFDEVRTLKAFEKFPMRDLSTPYKKGDVLVSAERIRQGLTEDDHLLLHTHRDAVVASHNQRLLGHALFIFIVFAILSFYVRRFSQHFQFKARTVVMIALPVLIALAMEAAIIFLSDGDSRQAGYLFPAGSIGLLGVLLLDVRMALLLVTWGCLLMGLQVDLNYNPVIVGLFGGYTAVAALATIRKRWEVFVASIIIGLVNTAVILIASYIRTPGTLAWDSASLGFFAGIASFLVLAILPVFERFGIVTDIQLLELTGLQHPLLRQIEEQAPGTWQHTLNVTKLAEAAASRIGVNYLLVRAGCYFHDIGKVRKPEYFTENQITNEDKSRHDALKPIMSARVIMNHVKEGIEMARAARLPERIIDFIPQHHGTTVITYFHNKALAQYERGDVKDEVRIDDFRYPGVKPQTIEAAIVMLADSVEATATARLSGRAVRPDDIQQVVRNTILDKFNDGQFDECNLTLRDLNIIRETFVDVLRSRFHTRIDYPKRTLAAPSRDRRGGDKSRDRVSREKVSQDRVSQEKPSPEKERVSQGG